MSGGCARPCCRAGDNGSPHQHETLSKIYPSKDWWKRGGYGMLTLRCSMGSRAHISRWRAGSSDVVTAEDIAGRRALMGAVLVDA